MTTSQNGWTASPTLAIRPLIVDGVQFVPGVRDNDDVAYVLGYVVNQYRLRVEPLTAGWCWGFSFRPNVNDPDNLSNHASGTAVDVNAPAHPNGVPTTTTFTAAQIAEVHTILTEAQNSVRWGGDFNGNPDAMHFEINVSPTQLAVVARELRETEEAKMPLNADDLRKISELIDARLVEFARTAGDTIKVDGDGDPSTPKVSLERKLRGLA